LNQHAGKYLKSTSNEYDRSDMTMDCAYAARRCGLPNGQIYTLLKTRHEPTMGRIRDGMDYDEEFNRIVARLNIEHPHEGKTCTSVECANMSERDREQATLATALKTGNSSTGGGVIELDDFLNTDEPEY